ncbi:uncharacterized protein [Rhodnius prolixus]|uniref:Male-enhanced antigen 1 n=2 Tax=Rhodnius TaxID=13248 RepID=T1I553_RHOPR
MVVLWSPEPSRSKDDCFTREDTSHIVMLDDDSEDDSILPFFGYELLPHDINNEYIQEAELGSDSDSSEGEELIQDEVPTSEGLHKPVTVTSEEHPRQDIVIDLDEVRAAMSNITLPDSAIPPWAANVPESQWTSFLVTRIRNMQNPNQNV